MALGFLKHKWQKVTLISVGVFIVVLFGAAIIINRSWSAILSSKIKKAVTEATDGIYTINFSSAEVRVLEGKILLYNIDFKLDSAVYKHRQQQGLAPNNLVELHVKRLVLSHIHPFKLYFKKIVDIDRITLNEPEVHVTYQLNHVKDTLDKDNRTVWQKVSQSVKYIHVGDIFLNDAKLKYTDYSGKKVGITELKEVNIQVNDLLIDSLTQTDTTRFLYCKDVIADINNFKGNSPDGLYSYTLKRARFSTLTSQLKIQDFKLVPTANYFAKTHKIRYAIKLDSIILNRFDFKTYNKYKSFSASNLIISRGAFDIFANPNAPKIYKDKIRSFPHVALFLVESPFKLDTLQIKNLTLATANTAKNPIVVAL
ncbi:hypothetical protein [Mucilaginibacter antarcticus]|uniref:hypothetical protein n=1 Tax=Mucilaginibacter antarcticus TaxID=1855725 RepID=UPI003630F376